MFSLILSLVWNFYLNDNFNFRKNQKLQWVWTVTELTYLDNAMFCSKTLYNVKVHCRCIAGACDGHTVCKFTKWHLSVIHMQYDPLWLISQVIPRLHNWLLRYFKMAEDFLKRLHIYFFCNIFIPYIVKKYLFWNI